MTSIERTAYPYISTNKAISQKTLVTNYTLSKEELDHIHQKGRGNRLRLNYAIQLKALMNLGYFVDVKDIPSLILEYIKKQLKLPHNLQPLYGHHKTLSRHRISIRSYLKVTPWKSKGGGSAQRIAMKAAYKASQTMNSPADIINVVIGELIEKHFELPAFNTLDRLVCHVRAKVNQGIFQNVIRHLKAQGFIETIDDLLVVEKEETYSEYQKLKQPSKTLTMTHFKDQINHHTWLMSLGTMEPFLKDLPKVKLKQFAQEAKALDSDNLKDLSDQKKYTLVACLLYQAQQMTKDTLGLFVCKTFFSVHKKAKKKLEVLKTQFADQTQDLAKFVLGMVTDYKTAPKQTRAFVSKFEKKIEDQGGIDVVADICQKIIAYHSKNHIPFLWDYFCRKRSAFFDFLSTVQLGSSTQSNHIIRALDFLKNHRHCRSDFISLNPDIDLNFASQKWKNFMYVGKSGDNSINRRYFELGMFNYLINELRSGDIFIEGADAFSDYRQHLLNGEECDLLVEDYLQELKFPKTAEKFATLLKNNLLQMARKVDKLYPQLSDFMIDETGLPVLKKVPTIKPTKTTSKLLDKIRRKMPERSLLGTLCLTHHLTGWAYEFGHISGVNSRLDNPIERYILNAFCQGTGMGPSQGAKHIKNSTVTAHMLSWINRRHVIPKQLDKSKDRLINYSQHFLLTTAWGDGRRCATDGTLRHIYEDNLIAESHFRYKAKGGIAYNHISDTYVALFSTFIPCGVWEAVEIIEGLLKNNSSIKPNTVHADTQGQSTVVFGLSYLLGIKLMPRIRNWKELTFFRATKEKYKTIDSLFGEEIDWDLIKTHWKDLLQVVLSIKQGKISSSFLLKKLTTYSRKNRLYHALQKLGCVKEN